MDASESCMCLFLEVGWFGSRAGADAEKTERVSRLEARKADVFMTDGGKNILTDGGKNILTDRGKNILASNVTNVWSFGMADTFVSETGVILVGLATSAIAEYALDWAEARTFLLVVVSE